MERIYLIYNDKELKIFNALKIKDINKEIFEYITYTYDIVPIYDIYCKEIPQEVEVYFKLKNMEITIDINGRLRIDDLLVITAALADKISKEELIYIYNHLQYEKNPRNILYLYANEKDMFSLIRDVYYNFDLNWTYKPYERNIVSLQ